MIRPTEEAPPDPGVPEVFRKALPLLRKVFVEYGIPEGTARSAETDLTAWFARFCRRNPDLGTDARILALLSLACSFSRGYVRTAPTPPSPELAALLAASPDAVAYRIAARVGVGTLPRPVSRLARLLSFGRKR